MTVELCDMSALQQLDQVDFAKVLASGVRGVWFRCTLYSGATDPTFPRGVQRAREAGLHVGAYHFCYMGSDPIAQMAHFFNHSNGVGMQPGDLPPMLDWEFCKTDKMGRPIPKEVSVAWLLAAASEAKSLWYPSGGRLPTIYTYPYFASERAQQLAAAGGLAKYPLTLAYYGNCVPAAPLPWDRITVVQYAGETGRVAGVGGPCDQDRFLGTEEAFQAFLGREATPVPSELETGSGGIVRTLQPIPGGYPIPGLMTEERMAA